MNRLTTEQEKTPPMNVLVTYELDSQTHMAQATADTYELARDAAFAKIPEGGTRLAIYVER